MIQYLLDTDVCIEAIHGRAPALLPRLRRRRIGAVGMSTITLAELQYGVARSSNPIQNTLALARLCAPLEIIPFDDDAASAYGRIRSELERRGKPIGPLDTLIAAHAVALGAVVVTGNVREFQRVGGLQVEKWTRP